jgi:hypothetical protein
MTAQQWLRVGVGMADSARVGKMIVISARQRDAAKSSLALCGIMLVI